MDDLTLLQRRVLSFLKNYINNNGYPPSVREIGRNTEIRSTATVHAILVVLEEKGYIIRDGKQSRSMTVLSGADSHGVFTVPLISCLGFDDGCSGSVDVPRSICKNSKGVFAVKVRKDIPELGYIAGDILIVDSKIIPDDGDIAVSEKEAPLKYSSGEKTLGKVIMCIRLY